MSKTLDKHMGRLLIDTIHELGHCGGFASQWSI
jgi:hypothetical protein